MEAINKAQQDGVVLGLAGVSSNAVPRLDVDDLLLNKPDTFNLFLLALSELQTDAHATDKMGWQQIAGIHGLPLAFWDGVKTPGKSRGAGYCAHGRPTFPTWHRPYVAMLEQTLYSKMSEIASRYPDASKAKYQKALQDFRLPYWDYYRPRNKGTTVMPGIKGAGGTTSFAYDFSVPQIFIVESVMIRRTSDDTLVSVKNPLRAFKFPDSGGLTPNDWLLAKGFSTVETVRYPMKDGDLAGDVTFQSYVLNREREGNVKIILDMMGTKAYNSYASFASDSRSPGASGSLEGIHGNYHLLIGGHTSLGSQNGHMSSTATAAFDPIFFLHHCQIDRWLAIWQAIHPDKWYDGQYYVWVNRQQQVAEVGPLSQEDALPFRSPNGKFWNGDASRDTSTFGYVYKDAVGAPQDVLDSFTQHYRWATRRRPGEPAQSPPDDMKPLNVDTAQVFDYPKAQAAFQAVGKAVHESQQAVLGAVKAGTASAAAAFGVDTPITNPVDASSSVSVQPAAAAADESASAVAFTNMAAANLVETVPSSVDESKYDRDWYVDNVVQRLAINGSFTIFYFIGNFDKQDVSSFGLQPTMAGINHVFTSSREACDNCGAQDEAGHLITDTKVITPMLLDYIEIGQLPDLSPERVVPFLIANLKWRIVDMDGNIVNPRTLAGFKVGVSSKLTPREGTEEPIYQEFPQVVEQIIANSS